MLGVPALACERPWERHARMYSGASSDFLAAARPSPSSMQQASCVVTGAAGFVGKHLVSALVSSQQYTTVRAVDLPSAWNAAARAEVAALNDSASGRCHVDIVAANICDASAMVVVCRAAVAVFHLAAIVDTRR